MADINHINGQINQFGAGTGGQIITAGFEQDRASKIGKLLFQIFHRGEIDRRILPDGGMRWQPLLEHREYGQKKAPGADQIISILTGIDIIGDNRHGNIIAQRPADGFSSYWFYDLPPQARRYRHAAGHIFITVLIHVL